MLAFASAKKFYRCIIYLFDGCLYKKILYVRLWWLRNGCNYSFMFNSLFVAHTRQHTFVFLAVCRSHILVLLQLYFDDCICFLSLSVVSISITVWIKCWMNRVIYFKWVLVPNNIIFFQKQPTMLNCAIQHEMYDIH